MSISASSGESWTGSLGDSVAPIVATPAIGGISLGGKKDTAYCFRDCEEELNEEEDPRKRIREEKITISLNPPGTISIFKILPQTDNQCSKVDVNHGKWFWCAICDIHVKNIDDLRLHHWPLGGAHEKWRAQ